MLYVSNDWVDQNLQNALNTWNDKLGHEYLFQEEVVKFEPYDVFSVENSKKEVINRSKNNPFCAVCLKV